MRRFRDRKRHNWTACVAALFELWRRCQRPGAFRVAIQAMPALKHARCLVAGPSPAKWAHRTMDTYDLTRIFGALCASLLLFLGVTYLLEGIYETHELVEPAYAVAPLDDGAGLAGAVVEEEPHIAELLPIGDVARGEKLFKRCAACHQADNATKHGVGPALWGILGRDIASLDGFAYSNTLEDLEGNWNWERLAEFLADPKGWAPGTKMNFAGLKKGRDRASVLLWLNDRSDAPLDLPQPPQVVEPIDEGADTESGEATGQQG